MNIRKYIKSGVIESYVLGLSSKDEKQEFEFVCLKFPEIYSARHVFELALEDQLMKETLLPPEELRQKI